MAVSITISITQNSQSVTDNTSNVTVQVNAKWTYGSYNKLQKSGYLIIDGTKYTFTAPFNTGQTTSGTCKLYAKTVDVPHNSDGTKILACSASYTSGVSSGTVDASVPDYKLTTIPRKSTLSVSNGTLGTKLPMTVTRQSTSFTHTITYKCGSTSGTVCSKSSDETPDWTPPLSLANQNTTGTSVSIKFTITTYNGSTSVGSNEKTISCSIPASVKPTCDVQVSDATSIYSTYGAYIKGLSKLKVNVEATPIYGSAISSYKTTTNGATYTDASFTTEYLKSSGSLTISSTVKDKRGRSGTDSETVTVLNYTEPVVSVLTVKRGNKDENNAFTANDQGEYVQASFSASVTNLSEKNTAKYILRYKRSSDGEYTEADGFDQYKNKWSVSGGTFIFPADTGSSYDVQIVVSDNFNTTTRYTSVSTAFTIMHFSADGTGIGIGKVAEEPELLDVGLPSRFIGPTCGTVMGLDVLPKIPSGSDLNDYMTPGSYAIYRNDEATTIANMPVAKAGRLEVSSSTGEGIRVTQWSYLRQRFIPYNGDSGVWERDITRDESNVWTYYDWWKSGLTPEASRHVYHGQKVLWGDQLTSGMFMTEGHTATLSEKISAQPNGIELVFCYYNGTSDTNWGWQTYQVSKHLVALEPGGGHSFKLANGKFGSVGTKYLYINDDRIVGHADNILTGTAGSGITYANNKFVLRYVIGV